MKNIVYITAVTLMGVAAVHAAEIMQTDYPNNYDNAVVYETPVEDQTVVVQDNPHYVGGYAGPYVGPWIGTGYYGAGYYGGYGRRGYGHRGYHHGGHRGHRAGHAHHRAGHHGGHHGRR
jgi:hypothetical protein